MSSTTALSRVCTSKPAGDGFGGQPGGARIGQAAGEQQPQILLRADNRDRLLGGVRRDDDLGENLGDGARRLGVERAVERDDAAEGRDRIAGERLAIGVEQSSSPSATPHGLACLMMAQAAVRAGSNSATHS